jgi:hypothetical protein
MLTLAPDVPKVRTMIDARRTKDDRVRDCRIDAADLAPRKLGRALPRLSIIRRSSDPASDMGEWIIDEVDGCGGT